MRPDRVATRAVFQQDALSDARHEFRFVVGAISDLIYHPKKFHACSLAASLVFGIPKAVGRRALMSQVCLCSSLPLVKHTAGRRVPPYRGGGGETAARGFPAH